jgi:hypothetical protein
MGPRHFRTAPSQRPWLALLAVLFQLLAPGLAMRGMAAAADPLANVTICTEHGGTTPSPDSAGHAHDGVCVACVSCCTGVAAAVFPAAPVLPLPSGLVAAQPRPWTASLPRGPPLERPRARSPPAFS